MLFRPSLLHYEFRILFFERDVRLQMCHYLFFSSMMCARLILSNRGLEDPQHIHAGDLDGYPNFPYTHYGYH